jgi:hypothetical protein
MQLTTIVPIQQAPFPIDYQSRVVMLGSCFAENIGAKLVDSGFHVVVNPFGIIFNSSSLKILIERSVSGITFTEDDVTEHFCYLAHSSLNSHDKEELIVNLNLAAQNLHDQLKTATHVMITLGTAWVYKHLEKGLIVANCHKQPQHLFVKELQEIEDINADLNCIFKQITSINKEVNITYTLSPVRHLKDGFVENQRSKARLHEAIQQQVDRQQAAYFPAYEIAMDQLRDYRFYSRDMMHLNSLGIDFIWLRFRESGINTNTLPQQKAIQKFRKLLHHRPKEFIKHQEQLDAMKVKLQSQYPEIRL